jgi:hypothetical protein
MKTLNKGKIDKNKRYLNQKQNHHATNFGVHERI